MIVAARFERDQRRANLAWVTGIVAVMAVTGAFWPSIEGTDSVDDVIEDLPANLQALIGATDGVSLGTPAGYLNARVFATVLPGGRRQRGRRHTRADPDQPGVPFPARCRARARRLAALVVVSAVAVVVGGRRFLSRDLR